MRIPSIGIDVRALKDVFSKQCASVGYVAGHRFELWINYYPDFVSPCRKFDSYHVMRSLWVVN